MGGATLSSRLQKALRATSTTPSTTAPTGARSWAPFETRRGLVSSCSSMCRPLWPLAGPQCYARRSPPSATCFVPKDASWSDRRRCVTQSLERPRRRTIAGWRRCTLASAHKPKGPSYKLNTCSLIGRPITPLGLPVETARTAWCGGCCTATPRQLAVSASPQLRLRLGGR